MKFGELKRNHGDGQKETMEQENKRERERERENLRPQIKFTTAASDGNALRHILSQHDNARSTMAARIEVTELQKSFNGHSGDPVVCRCVWSVLTFDVRLSPASLVGFNQLRVWAGPSRNQDVAAIPSRYPTADVPSFY